MASDLAAAVREIRRRALIDADSGLERAAREGDLLADLLDAIDRDVQSNDEFDGFNLDLLGDQYHAARKLAAAINSEADTEEAARG